ncbi:MAG: T9SS type A sorting domain-containing protein, partial [Moraxellaceae bacterium]
ASTADNWYIKIKHINNVFFAFGNRNSDYESVIMYSTDGITWTDVTPDLGFEVLYYKDVAFDGTSYHFFGVESASWTPIGFFSVSTATPANRASYANKATISNVPDGAVLGGTYDEGVLDYANGKFTGAVLDVVTGQDYIITSANGNSWTAIPQNSYSIITASIASGNTVQMIGRGNAFFTVNYGSVLPLSLLRFEGRLTQGQTQLSWSTAVEQNTKQFIVQHSLNRTTWSNIGVVTAAGSSQQNQSYRFVHSNPAKGQNFYRLQMEDKDGKTTQSGVVALSYGGKEGISTYPNPVSDKLVIRTESNLAGHLVLYNEVGQMVKTATLEGNVTTLNVAGLPSGVYHAEITQGQQTQRMSVIKK